MARSKVYATTSQRQKAYRERRKQESAEQSTLATQARSFARVIRLLSGERVRIRIPNLRGTDSQTLEDFTRYIFELQQTRSKAGKTDASSGSKEVQSAVRTRASRTAQPDK